MTANYPPYQNFPTLLSQGIVLRQSAKADINEILEISYYDGIQATDPEEALIMLEKIQEDYLKGNSIHWVIVDRKSDQVVGTCGYYRGFANSTGELGYILKPSFEGMGYMTKALKTAISFGINTIGLHKIIAITKNDNIKSQNVLKKLNFCQEAAEDTCITYTYQLDLP